jgi:hypothetical protein
MNAEPSDGSRADINAHVDTDINAHVDTDADVHVNTDADTDVDEAPPREGPAFDDVPPSPQAAVQAFYPYPDHPGWYRYHDGTSWMGEPQLFPWWKRPVAWWTGRPPVWLVLGWLALLGVIAVGHHFISAL